MALYHFHMAQVKRSAGQSAVASAAYRAGEKLYSDYYGESSDYTRKDGVVYSEILLPSHAPPEYAGRQTLWNAVENAERRQDAQLAHSFDIALQNEFSIEENVALARQFLSEQFVSRGMIVDFAVHLPDKKDSGIANPHFHVLCPIRPLDEHGRWGAKQRLVYRLGENGNRIIGKNGKPLADAVPTTDWSNPETLEAWRAAWAELCNKKFAEKGLDCRVDHRNYEKQRIDLLPTVHEGPVVRAMERKGIQTEKGELNRWIKSTNAAILKVKEKITSLLDWIKEVKDELSKPQEPDLASLLSAYYTQRNAGAYSHTAKVNNLKEMAADFSYLQENGIHALDDLESRAVAARDAADGLKTELNATTDREKQLRYLVGEIEIYDHLKPVYDRLQQIKFTRAREKYKDEHSDELKQLYAVRRTLRAEFPDGEFDRDKLLTEYTQLQAKHKEISVKFKEVRTESRRLWSIKFNIESAIRNQEKRREQMSTKQTTKQKRKDDEAL